MDQKSIIRKKKLKTRRALLSDTILHHSKFIIKNINAFLTLKHVQPETGHIYLSIQNEPDLSSLYQKWISAGVQLYAPVVQTDREFTSYPVTDLNDIRHGTLNTIEPVIRDTYPQKNQFDIILVPGVAFDRKGNRLGFGKGYYDHFLSATGGLKIGIAYDFQILDNIPVYKNDIPVDVVITEKEIITP